MRIFTKEHRKKMSETRKRLFSEGVLKPPLKGKFKEEHPFYGKKHTEEHKRKMSELMKGRIFTNEHKNNISITKKRLYKEGKIKSWNDGMAGKGLYKMNRKYPSLLGEKNPNWRGGKSFEPYAIEFNNNLKKQIKLRDGHVCQLCKEYIPKYKSKKEKFLSIHHIDYNKKNNETNNLITLCNFCNSSVNKNRVDWMNHFRGVLR